MCHTIINHRKRILFITFSFAVLCVVTSLDIQIYQRNENDTDTKSNSMNIFTEYTTVDPSGSPNQDLKYILQWASNNDEPLSCTGQDTFINRSCSYINCFITTNRLLLDDYTKFDVITFGPDLSRLSADTLPQRRSRHQKYVFISSEPSTTYPVLTDEFDGYFNWTWTYNLDSVLRWGSPFVIRNYPGRIIGPEINMKWVKTSRMLPALDKVKQVVYGKRRTAAWFVSNCNTSSKREEHAHQLRNVLLRKYKLHLDIYGNCGDLKCPKEIGDLCNEFLKKNYFFYLAFEKSLNEDYVTDKLFRALKYNVVPIVYGGADYNRFLPKGSYLDAREMDIDFLAAEIHDLVNNIDRYLDYFKWTNYYSYHRTEEEAETDVYCKICALLNDEKKMAEISVVNNFRSWWNDQHKKPIMVRKNTGIYRRTDLTRKKFFFQTNQKSKKQQSGILESVRKNLLAFKNFFRFSLGLDRKKYT